MGWKNVKTHFKITHNVQVTSKGLCIGSGYVHDLVVINLNTGVVCESPTFKGFLKEYYPQLLNTSPEDMIRLLESHDNFTTKIPVYTFEQGDVVIDYAEEFGYPHTTHSGNLMYENTHFKTFSEAKVAALRDLESNMEFTKDSLVRAQQDVSDLSAKLVSLEQQILKLKNRRE